MLAIQAARLITPTQSFSPGVVLIEGGKILAAGHPRQVPLPSTADILNFEDKIISPGLIDTHTHGRDGVYFGQEAGTTLQLLKSLAATGVTGVLPTLAGLSPAFRTLDGYLDAIRAVRAAMLQESPGAEILGIHMEGPFLNQSDAVRGSQLSDTLRSPSIAELRRMAAVSEGAIRKMSIAPELDSALRVIEQMVRLGIVPCAGHSYASFQQTMSAVEAGLSCATHTFNGMLPLHHRQPGLLGAILTCDKIHAELIADGQHVSFPVIDILLRCKGLERVHLVTDNTTWAGMPNGEYPETGRTIVKEELRVYVVGGTLIGSVAPLNGCVNNLIHRLGLPIEQAVQLASLNPARVIGVSDRKGSLEPGKDADLIVVDEQMNVFLTLVKGKEVFRHHG
jgi:N-acetylglucosamine-6-phosphate deacetylase